MHLSSLYVYPIMHLQGVIVYDSLYVYHRMVMYGACDDKTKRKRNDILEKGLYTIYGESYYISLQ